MSLVHPRDLGAWMAWQSDQHRLRQLKGRVVDAVFPPRTQWSIAAGDERPRIVVAMDSANPSAVQSLIAPLHHLRELPVAIVAPFALDAIAADLPLAVRPFSAGLVDGLVDDARCVVDGRPVPPGRRRHGAGRAPPRAASS